MGYLSSSTFGTFTGPMADKYGRRKMARVFGILYSVVCCMKLVRNFWVLLAGRVIGRYLQIQETFPLKVGDVKKTFDRWDIDELVIQRVRGMVRQRASRCQEAQSGMDTGDYSVTFFPI